MLPSVTRFKCFRHLRPSVRLAFSRCSHGTARASTAARSDRPFHELPQPSLRAARAWKRRDRKHMHCASIAAGCCSVKLKNVSRYFAWASDRHTHTHGGASTSARLLNRAHRESSPSTLPRREIGSFLKVAARVSCNLFVPQVV